MNLDPSLRKLDAFLNIPTTNRFGLLAEPEITNNKLSMDSQPRSQSSQSSQPSTQSSSEIVNTSTKILPKKPPLIVVKSKIADNKIFYNKIKTLVNNKDFRILYLTNETKICLSTSKDFNLLCKQFLNNEVQFYSITPKDKRIYKIVLKAAYFVTPAEISIILKENDIQDFTCIKFKSNKSRSSSFLISTKNKSDFNKLTLIQTLDNFQIKWEKYCKKSVMAQCHRCQSYSHGSSNCNLKQKCVNCAESHSTEDHPEFVNTLKCVNCVSEHTANHKSCSKYVKHMERILKKGNKNAVKTFTSNYVKPNASFASITQNNSNNQITSPTQTTTTHSLFLTFYNSFNSISSKIDNFKTLITELNNLNQICNITMLIPMVRELKLKLTSAKNNFEKLAIFHKLSEKYQQIQTIKNI